MAYQTLKFIRQIRCLPVSYPYENFPFFYYGGSMTYPTIMQDLEQLKTISYPHFHEKEDAIDSLFKNFLTQHPTRTLDDIHDVHHCLGKHFITKLFTEKQGMPFILSWMKHQREDATRMVPIIRDSPSTTYHI